MNVRISLKPRASPRGFTILEAMIALAVLLIGLFGAVLGLISVSQEVRQGALRQAEMLLINAKAQRLLVQDKSQPGALPAASLVPAPPDSLALGAAPWSLDRSTPVAGDSGTGAFFRISGDGLIVPMTCIAPGNPVGCIDATTIASCADATLPKDIYCREVLVAAGLPPQVAAPGQSNASAAANLAAAGAQATTLWVRIARVSEPINRAVIFREVFVQ